MHPAIGRLRERSAPPDRWLDRLRSLIPQGKLHWFPEYGAAEGGQWIIADHRASVAYRDAGLHLLARLRQSEVDTGKPAPRYLAYGAELMVDGGHIAAVYAPEATWEWMLADLQESEERLKRLDAQVRQAQRVTELKALIREGEHDGEYLDRVYALMDAAPEWKHLRDEFVAIAQEDWGYFMRGRRSVGGTALPTAGV